MEKVKVYWTENALREVEEIGDYIALDSPERAIEFAKRLLDSTSHLEDFPLSGAICREDASCRYVVVIGYRVIYEATVRGIEVLTVVSPGQRRSSLK